MGFRDPGVTYTAIMAPLEPGVTYYYTVGSDDESSGWSHEHADERRRSATAHSLTTATASASASTETEADAEARESALSFVGPPVGKEGYFGDGVSFSAFGDMGKQASAWDGSLEHSWDNPPGLGEIGSWNTSALLEREVLAGNTTMVLHIGDIAYSVGYASEWDEFMAQIEPVAARLPWMTGIGNHEMNCPCATGPAELTWISGSDSGGECGVPYNSHFIMPPPSGTLASRPAEAPVPPSSSSRTGPFERPGPSAAPPPHGSGGFPWYAFAYGPVYIVVMSTEHDFTVGSPQYSDLVRYLAAVDREVTPWVVFTGHRPMYISSAYPSDEHIPLTTHIEPLLIQYGVDLALWGHHHSYQRSCPMINGTCTARAPAPAPGSGNSNASSGVVHAVIGVAGYEFSATASGSDIPSWVEYQEYDQYGYSRIHADAKTLRFSFVATATGTVLDETTLESRY